MFTFHKPKVFRSANGCCICKAKSSSSRFTDSKKYEGVFVRCFDLDEIRTGEICNACVLLVKRFLKLPSDSTRNWNHVVDARSGPGIKSLVKSKNKKIKAAAAASVAAAAAVDLDLEMESPEKLKKKHVYKRKAAAPIRQRNPSIAVSDFLDMTFWKREKVCCGTIFRGPYGEVAIDARYYNPCYACKVDKVAPLSPSVALDQSDVAITDNEEDFSLLMYEDDDEDDEDIQSSNHHLEAARKLSASVSSSAVGSASATAAAATAVGDVEDEGFFDKPAASPLSGGSNTPPPSEDLEEFGQMEVVRTTRSIAAAASSRFGDDDGT